MGNDNRQLYMGNIGKQRNITQHMVDLSKQFVTI